MTHSRRSSQVDLDLLKISDNGTVLMTNSDVTAETAAASASVTLADALLTEERQLDELNYRLLTERARVFEEMWANLKPKLTCSLCSGLLNRATAHAQTSSLWCSKCADDFVTLNEHCPVVVCDCKGKGLIRVNQVDHIIEQMQGHLTEAMSSAEKEVEAAKARGSLT